MQYMYAATVRTADCKGQQQLMYSRPSLQSIPIPHSTFEASMHRDSASDTIAALLAGDSVATSPNLPSAKLLYTQSLTPKALRPKLYLQQQAAPAAPLIHVTHAQAAVTPKAP